MRQNGKSYVLGLDLGVVSLGWAVIETNDQGPAGLLAAGSHCWELSHATPDDVEKGKEEPPGQTRRQARQIRRQLFRRAQRLRRTYRALQKLGLFPSGPWSSAARKSYLDSLDREAKEWLKQNAPSQVDNGLLDHTFVYHLRAVALDQALPPHLLGRVFFHLAQRRGFLSNRRASAKDEKQGEVKQAISQLQREINESGARTLGEYLSRIDPHQQRIRGRWTSRQMYQQEFDLIWNAQQSHHPGILTDENRDQLFKAIFSQRPLKSQKGLVGRCALETCTRKLPGGGIEVIYPHRRAPMASLEAQRIRYMQRINDLEFVDPGKNVRPLTQSDREKLYELAERHEDLSFNMIKKALGIPIGKKNAGWECNLERGGEKKLPGNRTAARIRSIIGDERWESLSGDQQKRLVDTLIAYLSPEALSRHLQTVWKFDLDTAENLARIELEDGYHSFSRRAIRKLLPLLEQGKRLNEAIQTVYGSTRWTTRQHAALPPVRTVMPTVRNPLLVRALTELRKVVNALIRRYGQPQLIRIELARELKKSRKEREAMTRRMREQEARREEAARKILADFGREATARDIEKYLLAEECGWTCPYTGKKITMETLLGDQPQFDVEHIWPRDRSLDDSFVNKTLCYHEENRAVKAGRTPFEAYGHDPQRWHEIITRVKQFQGPFARKKLERFLAQQIPTDFAQRDLNDTRWISRAAADYLGHLYGGRIDPTGRQRVFTVTGGLTALVRRAWNLNAVLGGGTEKERHDHRHHAIDAIVIALTEPTLVQRLSRAAARLSNVSSRTAIQIDPPWENFLDDVRRNIEQIVVSYRPNRRLSGPLHDQTYYAPPVEDQKTKVRKSLSQLSPEEVEKIVDPVVRELVQKRLAELGKKDPKKAFATDANLPLLRGKGNTTIPIKSVRIWVSARVTAVGTGHRTRYVIPGNNHHIEIYAILDQQGNETQWKGKIVSLYEALQRKKRGEPVVCRDHGPNTRFKFSLAKSDYIEWVTKDNEKQLLRVVSVSHKIIEFRLPHDGRPTTLIRKQKKERIVPTVSQLLQRRARKVFVTPLGEVLPAND